MKKTVLLISLLASAAQAATYYVSPGGDDANGGLSWETAKRSIQEALNALIADGDEIVVTNGTYTSFSTGPRTVIINSRKKQFRTVYPPSRITIRSVNGAEHTIIDGSGRICVLESQSARTNTVLSGFTLTNGYAAVYGGTLNDCVLVGNKGGAERSVLNNCVLLNNAGRGPGGGALDCILNNCRIEGNTATGSGGGVFRCTLNNCTLVRNTARHGGGAEASTLNNCTLIENTATECGGGAHNSTLNNCTLIENTAAEGGGAYRSTLNVCTLSGNKATNGGGTGGGSTLVDCTLIGNAATGNYGRAYGNTATGNGGGAYRSSLSNCTLSKNTASDNGGGVAECGRITNGVLSGNTAKNNGGGAWNCSLSHCTLIENKATNGGGVYGGHSTLHNCVLWKNTATEMGGGVYHNDDRGSFTLINCTVSGNTAKVGGGSYMAIHYNCIVWENFDSTGELNNYFPPKVLSKDPHVFSITSVFRYSCSMPLPSGANSRESRIALPQEWKNIAQDPLFVDAANGDFRLKEGSPCIDAGDNLERGSWGGVGEVDRDGNLRIHNGTVDMGAYEFGAPPRE